MNIKCCPDCKKQLLSNEIVTHSPRCIECRREKAREWRSKNKEHYAEYFRNYRKTEKGKQQYLKLRNNEEYRNKVREWAKNKLLTDEVYKLCHNCRTVINMHLKNNKLPKTGSSVTYLGTSDFNFIKQYLESKFLPGMNWSNWGKGVGKWNIDHIIPLASANSIEELTKLLHYTNLQPLWAEDNSSKGSLYNGVRHKYTTDMK